MRLARGLVWKDPQADAQGRAAASNKWTYVHVRLRPQSSRKQIVRLLAARFSAVFRSPELAGVSKAKEEA